jgi:hypothetical protein
MMGSSLSPITYIPPVPPVCPTVGPSRSYLYLSTNASSFEWLVNPAVNVAGVELHWIMSAIQGGPGFWISFQTAANVQLAHAYHNAGGIVTFNLILPGGYGIAVNSAGGGQQLALTAGYRVI